MANRLLYGNRIAEPFDSEWIQENIHKAGQKIREKKLLDKVFGGDYSDPVFEFLFQSDQLCRERFDRGEIKAHFFEQGVLIRFDGLTVCFSNQGVLHNEVCPVVFRQGTTPLAAWFLDGKIHRDNEPAYIVKGVSRWFQNGLMHREDGPAAVWNNGRREYWVNGQLHRTDGPAVFNDDHEEWWQNGVLHRTNGPAVVTKVYEEYWNQGLRHRVDGPALMTKEHKEWWLQGNRTSPR